MGAGLVIVAVPERPSCRWCKPDMTEAAFLPLPETDEGTVAAEATLEPVLAALERAHALASVPGSRAARRRPAFVRELVRASPVPVVVDADGLNAFAARAAELADRKADAVITPHEGEFGRLTGVSAHDLDADRFGTRDRSPPTQRRGDVAQGQPDPDRGTAAGARGSTSPGSPVLATAGSGDVLTGVIGGLLARGLDPFDAASAGAYLHGEAGLLAGRSTGEGTLAGDVVGRIPEAVERCEGRSEPSVPPDVGRGRPRGDPPQRSALSPRTPS